MNKCCEQTLLQSLEHKVVNKSYEKNINTNCQEDILENQQNIGKSCE